MARLHHLLLLKLVAAAAALLLRDRIMSGVQDDSPTLIHMAAILPDAGGRRLSTAAATTSGGRAWPFSIQNVSPAIDVALRRLNNDRIAFDVKSVLASAIAAHVALAFLARDVTYTSILMLRCQCPSVCPSVFDGSALAHYS